MILLHEIAWVDLLTRAAALAINMTRCHMSTCTSKYVLRINTTTPIYSLPLSRRRTAIKPAKRQSQRQPFINLLRLTVANRTGPSARVQRAAACASPTNYHDVGITGHLPRQTAHISLPSFQPVGGGRQRQTTRTHRALPYREVSVGSPAGIAAAETWRQPSG